MRLAFAPLAGVEIRDASGTGDGSWVIEGYAAVFETETVLWDVAGWWRCREEIATGAFDDVLGRVAVGHELVHLNHGHDMAKVVAATDVRGVGSLQLGSDMHGLRYFARVDPEDPDVKAAATKMRRGIIRQSSFAFTVGEESLVESRELPDGSIDELWRIERIQNLYDVCFCAQGAYPQTEAALSERVAGLDPMSAELSARAIVDGRSRYLAAAARASVGQHAIDIEGFGEHDSSGRTPTCVGHHGRSLEGRHRVAPGHPVGEGEADAERALARAKASADALTETTLRRLNK